MSEKMVGRIQSFATPGRDSLAEMQGVPINDDGGEQVEAGDPAMLALGGAVADFALTTDAQGILQRVVRLAFVEADLGAALHPGVGVIAECLFERRLSV